MRQTVSKALRDVFSTENTTPKPPLPIRSDDLLRHIIGRSPVDSRPALRLSDLTAFEGALKDLTHSWEHGKIETEHDGRRLKLTSVQLIVRKRKRDEDDSDSYGSHPPIASVSSGNKELDYVYHLLKHGTAKGKLLAERFRSTNGSFEPICPNITKEECAEYRHSIGISASSPLICDRVHFRALMRPYTDPSLGHCSYLNTCYSEPTYAMSPSIPPLPSASRPQSSVSLPSGLGAGGRGKEKAPCRYLHFEIDYDPQEDGGPNHARYNRIKNDKGPKLQIGLGPDENGDRKPYPPQWINCDVRKFDYSVLGKFHVIMADPPWDIHMSLPYGTMTDDEMRAMPIPTLQDEGLLFLWVTGRAMEVGRECLRVWGYTRVDEVVWLKTNQLQRVIRTGRTGHWLNHTKEHMLVGLKAPSDENGNLRWPSWINRGIDTDVIVSEVRETSRKPEEVYGLIERMCPGGRKIEIFGRKHNARPGWITLGNQLGPDQIYEEDLAARIKAKYPHRTVNTAQVV